MRENRTYGSEGGEASAFPTLSGYRLAGSCREQPTRSAAIGPKGPEIAQGNDVTRH